MDLDQDEGILRFTFANGLIVEALAQIIGTFNSLNSTWMWGWNNPSIDEPLKADALKVRRYGEQHQIARLTTPQWQAEETNAWDMVALAARLCNSQEPRIGGQPEQRSSSSPSA